MTDSRPHIQIYTDGGADPNPGAGGWAAILIHPQKTRELSGGEAHTTNNRMELTAAIQALQALSQPCLIDFYTDSQYLKDGITKWLAGWQRKGWLDSKGEPVKNQDLWQELASALADHDIHWHWVRGHAGNEYNERADQLATAARPKVQTQLDDNATRIFLSISGPKQGTQGTCGWAARVQRAENPSEHQGRGLNTTVNHLTLKVLIELLRKLPPDEPLQIFTNNSYIYDGITNWVNGWRKGGWQKPDKFNAEWQTLDQENQRHRVQWVRVRDKEFAEEFKGLEKRATAARDEAK